MEKIDLNQLGTFAGLNQQPAKIKKKKKAAFSKLFTKAEASADNEVHLGMLGGKSLSDAELAGIVDDINEAGRDLKSQPTLTNVLKYKKKIQQFMQYAVGRSFISEEVAGARISPLKPQKRYTVIQVIDQKLEKLTAGIIQQQLPQLEILKRVDEINGLIVDLLG